MNKYIDPEGVKSLFKKVVSKSSRADGNKDLADVMTQLINVAIKDPTVLNVFADAIDTIAEDHILLKLDENFVKVYQSQLLDGIKVSDMSVFVEICRIMSADNLVLINEGLLAKKFSITRRRLIPHIQSLIQQGLIAEYPINLIKSDLSNNDGKLYMVNPYVANKREHVKALLLQWVKDCGMQDNHKDITRQFIDINDVGLERQTIECRSRETGKTLQYGFIYDPSKEKAASAGTDTASEDNSSDDKLDDMIPQFDLDSNIMADPFNESVDL